MEPASLPQWGPSAQWVDGMKVHAPWETWPQARAPQQVQQETHSMTEHGDVTLVVGPMEGTQRGKSTLPQENVCCYITRQRGHDVLLDCLYPPVIAVAYLNAYGNLPASSQQEPPVTWPHIESIGKQGVYTM